MMISCRRISSGITISDGLAVIFVRGVNQRFCGVAGGTWSPLPSRQRVKQAML
jgi:hypothetical protein